jgi:hypothetical protein
MSLSVGAGGRGPGRAGGGLSGRCRVEHSLRLEWCNRRDQLPCNTTDSLQAIVANCKVLWRLVRTHNPGVSSLIHTNPPPPAPLLPRVLPSIRALSNSNFILPSALCMLPVIPIPILLNVFSPQHYYFVKNCEAG